MWLTSLIHADVGRLDITVHDSFLMSGVDGFADRNENLQQLIDFFARRCTLPTVSSLVQPFVQIQSFHEMDDDEGCTLVGQATVDHVRNMRVIQFDEDPHLTIESFLGGLRTQGTAVDGFDGHRLPGRNLRGAKYGRLPAGAHSSLDLVARDAEPHTAIGGVCHRLCRIRSRGVPQSSVNALQLL